MKTCQHRKDGQTWVGIAVYSPRLDAKGNSVRGIMVCTELADRMGLHALEFTNVGSSFCAIDDVSKNRPARVEHLI